jgi:hypothetical protein
LSYAPIPGLRPKRRALCSGNCSVQAARNSF